MPSSDLMSAPGLRQTNADANALEWLLISSRGGHTRCSRDWSSVVCSSDLDENHAHGHGRHVYGYPLAQRPGGVYSHEQRGGDRAAVVFEPEASAARTGQTRARQEWQEILAGSLPIAGL